MSFTSTGRGLALVCAAALLFGSAGAFASDGTTAALRASASAAAKDVYTYIATRPTAVNNGLILGQHLGGFNDLPGGANPGYFSMTQHGVANNSSPPVTLYPGLVGARYDANDKSQQGTPYVLSPAYDQSINASLISIWQTYHPIIALTATPPNPWDNSYGRSPSPSDQPLSTLLRTKANIDNPSDAFKSFWHDASVIADGLEELKNQGIPVVFRPFAEYNVGKYYGPPSPHGTAVATGPDFKALWADVWRYYVNDRHLNNLIFCWEAWVLNRSAAQADLASWFPDPSTVDIVSGAYYFQDPDTAFPPASNYQLTLSDTATTFDKTTHQNLLALAETYNKPFGVAQWGLYYNPGQNCLDSPQGDARDAIGFFNSVLSSANNRRRTAFIYHWVNACAIEKQAHNSEFVSNPVVATTDEVAHVVAYPSDVNGSPDGWVLEDPQHLGYGLQAQTSAGPLLTGDTAANRRYRSILTFNTVGIPPTATITSVTLRVRRSAVTPNGNPYTLFGPLTVDIASPSGFGGSLGLSKEDFQQVAGVDTLNVATLSDPAADDLGWAEAALSPAGVAKLNRAGVTQLRILFNAPSNNNGKNDYLSWYAGDTSTLNAADRPRLVVGYRY